MLNNARIKVFDLYLTTNIHKLIHFHPPYFLLSSQFYPIEFAQSFSLFTCIVGPKGKTLDLQINLFIMGIFSSLFLVMGHSRWFIEK